MPVSPFDPFHASHVTPDLPPRYSEVVNAVNLRAALPVADVTNQAHVGAWPQSRESGGEVRPRRSRNAGFPCGDLPEVVLRELEQELARRRRTDLDLQAARGALGAMMQASAARQDQPSAPSLEMIGGGLFADEAMPDVPSRRDIQCLRNRVAKLAAKKQQLAERHRQEMQSLELKILKLEARSRSNAPPADPPNTAYLRPS